jgi:hypothetical protein
MPLSTSPKAARSHRSPVQVSQYALRAAGRKLLLADDARIVYFGVGAKFEVEKSS